jgi:glyoxylase I family protein
MDLRGFHHLAIQVRHLPEAVAFYQRVLGLPELKRHHRPDGSLRSVWLEVPGGFLALEEASGEVVETPFRCGRPGLHLLALRIDAAARARVLAELAEKGIAVVHQTRWSIYFRDPEGNRIALSHHPEDPPV